MKSVSNTLSGCRSQNRLLEEEPLGRSTSQGSNIPSRGQVGQSSTCGEDSTIQKLHQGGKAGSWSIITENRREELQSAASRLRPKIIFKCPASVPSKKKLSKSGSHFKPVNLKLPNPRKCTLDFLPPWKQQSMQPTDWPPMNFR